MFEDLGAIATLAVPAAQETGVGGRRPSAPDRSPYFELLEALGL